MSLEARLAEELVRSHPDRAAAALEKVGLDARLAVLSGSSAAAVGAVVQRLSPSAARDVLDSLAPERAAEVLDTLELDVAARLLRRTDEARSTAIVERLPRRSARAVRSILRFPELTAGALMDPNVLALPEDLTARDALDRVRETPEQARYNLYVVDREQKLVGVVNLRELFLARPDQHLSDLMTREPLRLPAHADRAQLISHPGWKEVHSLPVVDEQGCYVGTVRYRTMRELEEHLLGHIEPDSSASQALGQLFAAGAAGVLDALAPQNLSAKGGVTS